MSTTKPRHRRSRLVLDLWVLVLALVLSWPMVTSGGYGLSGDLVFSPHQPLTWQTLGLAPTPPRAVPLEALVSLLESLVGGAVVFRVAVLGTLLLAGCGAHRLVGGLPLGARAAAATLAVWNPYVVERLGLGQWALVLAYASCFLVAARAVDVRTGVPGAVWRLVPWLALGSLTPTGGILTTLVATAMSRQGRQRRGWLVLGIGVLLQLPWLVPAVLGGAGATSDPHGIAAFSARADAPGGTLVSLLGLGGIWDATSVPATRGTFLGVLAALLVVAVLVLGGRHLSRDLQPLLPVGLLGLVLAAATSVPAGRSAMEWAVREVPGAGLLRDSQKWLGLLAVLVVVCFATGAARLGQAHRPRWQELGTVLVPVAVVLPLALLPDAATTTWRAVQPVRYPTDFAAATRIVEDSPLPGDVVTLPWRAYRLFRWGGSRTVFDPATAWLARPVVGSGALAVGQVHLAGESERASQVHAALVSGAPLPAALGEVGVGWVLVYADDPAVASLRLTGLDRVYAGPQLALYRVPAHVNPPPRRPAWQRLLVGSVDAVVLGAVLASAAIGIGVRRRRRRPAAGC
ncbi:MAG: hypothetical protein M3Z50_09340 [Actinomycetota bacterium]|nr:hypothetical protein [Actinomycetota bacterium]